METFEAKLGFAFPFGEFYSQPEYGPGIVPGTAKEAKGFWKRGRIWVSDRGHSSAGSSGGVAALQVVGGQHGGMTGLGNLFQFLGTTWFAGSGNAVLNGSVLGAGTGFLMIMVSGSPVQAGLAKPSAPTFETTATVSNKFNGTYSIALVAVRSTTGAISNRSNPSAVISVKNKKGLVTFPSPPAGATHWLLYGSRKGHGTNGPWYKITSIDPVAVATPTIEIDYVDGELSELAPITNDPPPACTHAFALGGSVCVVTSGGMIYPSKVGQPEAFDPRVAVRLASGEAPTAVTARGSDGGVFVATRNSISLVVATGSEFAPVLPRGVFEDVGVAHANAMAFVHDTLYVFSSTGSLCRTHGGERPDESFAEPQEDYFLDNGFTGDNTRLIHDQRNDALLVCSGSKCKPFMLKSEEWSGEITLPGSVTAGIGLNGSGLVDVGGSLFTLDTAGGSPNGTAFLRSPYMSVEGYSGHYMTLRYLEAVASGAMDLDLFKDRSGSSVGSPYPYTLAAGHNQWVKSNKKALRSLSCKVSTTAGGREFENATATVLVEPAHV